VYNIPKQSPFLDIIFLFKLKQEDLEAGSDSVLRCGEGVHLVDHMERTILIFPQLMAEEQPASQNVIL
jgi:ribosomal protein S27AE